MSSASFSANAYIRDCGCPGGRNGKMDASTTLRFLVPITRAFESTTAFGSEALPMAQVEDACPSGCTALFEYCKRSSLDAIFGPGSVSGPIVMLVALHKSRTRSMPASMISTSAWLVKKPKSIRGGSAVFALLIVTDPLDCGATSPTAIVP